MGAQDVAMVLHALVKLDLCFTPNQAMGATEARLLRLLYQRVCVYRYIDRDIHIVCVCVCIYVYIYIHT